ncbi:MAG TPA: discoidin domain-containing protein [Acidisarcina sp.]
MDADLAIGRGEGLMAAMADRYVRCVLYGVILAGSVVVSQPPVILRAEGAKAQAAKDPLQIEMRDATDARVAGLDPSARPSKQGQAVLSFDREYQPGDRIVFHGEPRMAVQVDETIPECLIYIPASAQGSFSYEIPYGREEKQTGSAYAPESFAGNSHRVTARELTAKETKGYRNLALNPCDVPRPEDAAIEFFPHASSNSVSRGLYDFEARNAIDGATKNGHHGVWPYQSWGPQLRTDIWWKVDFGRPVELDKIRVMVRADFPHDSYWKSADVEFSDGSKVPLQIASSAEFQDFKFSKRRVSWMRIINVVPVDPARWCAFIEVEAWGHDIR